MAQYELTQREVHLLINSLIIRQDYCRSAIQHPPENLKNSVGFRRRMNAESDEMVALIVKLAEKCEDPDSVARDDDPLKGDQDV